MLLVGGMLVMSGHADDGKPRPGAGDNPFRSLAQRAQVV
jgi:hypothetical protein